MRAIFNIKQGRVVARVPNDWKGTVPAGCRLIEQEAAQTLTRELREHWKERARFQFERDEHERRLRERETELSAMRERVDRDRRIADERLEAARRLEDRQRELDAAWRNVASERAGVLDRERLMQERYRARVLKLEKREAALRRKERGV